MTPTTETSEPLEIPVTQRTARRAVPVLVVVRAAEAEAAPAETEGATLAA